MTSFMQHIFPDAEHASSKSLVQRSSTKKRSKRKTDNSLTARSSTMKSTSGLAQIFTNETIRDAFNELRERREDTDITENEVDDINNTEVMESGEYSDRVDVDEEMEYETEGNVNNGDGMPQDDYMNSFVDEILETEDENEVGSITSGYGTIRGDSSHFTEEEGFQTTDDNEDDPITGNLIREDNHDSEMEYDADKSGTSDESMAQDDSPLFATFPNSEYGDEYDIEEDPESGVNGDYGDYGDERSISMTSIDEEEIQIEPEEHREFRRYVANDGPGIHESAFEHFRTKIASGILLKEFLREKELRDVDDSCAVSEISEDEDEVNDEIDDDYDVEPPLDEMDIRLRRTLRSAINSLEELLPDDEDCLLLQKERKMNIENDPSQRPTFPGLRRREAKEVEEAVAESNLIGYDSKAGIKRILNSALVAHPEDLLEAGKVAKEYWRSCTQQWKDMIEIQEETIQLTTPKKRSSALRASTSRKQKRKRKESVIDIPSTSPIAKRFASGGLRRKSQDFEIYEDSPSPLKRAEIFDLDAFDDFIEAARTRLRFSICISSGMEERDEFKLYEALGVQLVKFLKVKKRKDGEDKVFDVGVLYGLLKDLLKKVEGDDEFVRFNFFNPLVKGIDRGAMLDGEGDVKLVFNGVREEGV